MPRADLFTEWLEGLRPRPRVRALGAGFVAAEWSRPDRLDETSRERIYSTLVPVSTRAFGADMAPYWAGRRERGYFSTITRFAVIGNADEGMVGWTGYHRLRCAGRPSLYLDSTGIVPEHQHSGVVQALQGRLVGRELMRNPVRRVALITRTENPIIYSMLRKAAGPEHIHPRPGAEVPEPIARLGAEVAAWLGQEEIYDPLTLRLVGAYDDLDALYGDLPKCRDPELNEFFAERLTPLDAFLVIAEASLVSALPYIGRGQVRKWMERVLG